MSARRTRVPHPSTSLEIRLAARPLVLFTGILGAGKTTFLRTLLPVLNRLGIPARVVINDYHNAAVDAATLAHLTDEVTAVSGSCVCCDSRDELFEVLVLPPRQPDEVLLVEGIPRHEWDELRVDWSERLRSDPDLARKVRKAVGRARRTLEASLLAAESP